jgi:hypothetical protein
LKVCRCMKYDDWITIWINLINCAIFTFVAWSIWLSLDPPLLKSNFHTNCNFYTMDISWK